MNQPDQVPTYAIAIVWGMIALMLALLILQQGCSALPVEQTVSGERASAEVVVAEDLVAVETEASAEVLSIPISASVRAEWRGEVECLWLVLSVYGLRWEWSPPSQEQTCEKP